MLSVAFRTFAILAVAGILNGLPIVADQVRLEVEPAYGVLQADQKQTAWVRVSLTGFETESAKRRSPVNIALVLDKSGSMQGTKIAKAREAAIGAIRRLRPDDIISVISYDSTVTVVVPATKLADKETVIAAISRIQANGNTALFAGVSKGAAEIRKFLAKERVNRIILLSDGKANVGPRSPGELGSLGASLKKENISVSTLGLGLGYNEDLMVQLASRSGGNHMFIENATELADIFDTEFDDILSVVAQDIEVQITIPDSIRPVRVLGNDAEINGQQVMLNLSQVYSKQSRYIVMEVEVPAMETGSRLGLASVVVNYRNIKSNAYDRLTGVVSVTFSDGKKSVDASLNRNVLEDVVVLVANDQNKLATDFLDRGNIEKCREFLCTNREFLITNANKLDSERLREQVDWNASQIQQVDAKELNRARKSMVAGQYKNDFQQKTAPRSEK